MRVRVGPLIEARAPVRPPRRMINTAARIHAATARHARRKTVKITKMCFWVGGGVKGGARVQEGHPLPTVGRGWSIYIPRTFRSPQSRADHAPITQIREIGSKPPNHSN